MYKDRIQQLLETLNVKVAVIEKVANGSLRITNEDTIRVIDEVKQLLERVSNLVENER
jgi:hypothetical protein